MIVLYHGTNVEFHAPDVDAGRSGMDFGRRSMSSGGCRRSNIKRCSIRFIRKMLPTGS